MRIRIFALFVGLLISFAAQAVEITLYKDPDCLCCKRYVQYLRDNGFTVNVENVTNIQSFVRDTPKHLQGCHVAKIGGYIVEGHVPVEDINRLLRERPNIVGITVPGMPFGSPGMENLGTTQHYEVITFDKTGNTTIYSRH